MDTHTGADGAGPRLLSIGSTGLAGARGPRAGECRPRLLEMLTWILEHPGHSSAQMANQLALAESTARSYLCHLRSWLGGGPEGEPYLPMAYSSRMLASPLVGWDIRDALGLLGRDPAECDDWSLVCALDLVRGPVFADIGQGQWRWADPLRLHVSALLAGAARELAGRARRQGDAGMASWAVLKAATLRPWDKGPRLARNRLNPQTSPEPRFDAKQFLNNNQKQ